LPGSSKDLLSGGAGEVLRPGPEGKAGVVGELPAGLPRFAEALMAVAGLALSAPIIAAAAAAVAMTSGFPIFFRQERVGRYGRPFVLIKLRTMRPSGGGPQVTATDDSRMTTVGRFLRRAKIDELPELWNIVRGDMSFVGPRPEVARYVHAEDGRWQEILCARPGLTDPVTLKLRNEEALLAQVQGDRDQFYRETLQPLKLQGYCEYLRRRSWWSDLGVLSKTVIAIIWPGRTGSTGPPDFANKPPGT